MNMTEETRDYFYTRESPQENILFAAFYIVVFVVAVPGNAIALWTFYHQESTSSSKVFLRHLAIADISYMLIVPMRTVYHLAAGHWPFGQVACRLVGFLFYLNMYCSLYLMSFISFDRLLAVVLPVRSRTARKPVYAKVAVGILWVTVIVSLSPVLLSSKLVTVNVDNTTVTCNQLYLERPSPTVLVSTILAFVIPLFVTLMSYVVILVKLGTMKQQRRSTVKDKAVRMITLTMINFLLALVPYHVSRIIYIQSHSQSHVTTATLAIVNRITSALSCVSSVLDPVMYFFLVNTYRKVLVKLLCGYRKN